MVRLKDSTKNWIEQSVKYFREMGFFRSGFELEKIHEALRDNYFDEYLEKHPGPGGWGALDWLLLEQDTERTSQVGQETVYTDHVKVLYLETIRHWSAISRGAFTPDDVVFQWVDKGLFEIDFSFRGRSLKFRSDLWSRIDHELLYTINDLIRDTEFQFYLCNPDGIESQVIALTVSEKDQLVRERGWDCYP